MTEAPIDFTELLRKKRAEVDAKRAANAPPPLPTPPSLIPEAPTGEQFDADLVPDVLTERTPEDEEMDRVIESITIVDAYNRWCGKMAPNVSAKQREGVKISCPIPGHVDKNPSAWLNLDKNVWYCSGCNEGGDAYDLASFYFGVRNYKGDGPAFHNLRRQMAESMGWTKQVYPGGVSIMVPPEPEPAPLSAPIPALPPPVNPSAPLALAPPPELVPALNNVVSLDPVQDLIDEDEESLLDNTLFPPIPWRDIVPRDTFLWQYMEQTTIDDVPEEYHFWNGMLALGFACGKDVSLFDRIPVFGNLFICILGHSGSGKSQSRYHLDQLIAKAMKVDYSDPFSKGVEVIGSPSSAEYLVHAFQRPILDPSTNKPIGNAPVRGLVDFNELSALVGRMNRTGNTLKPVLMEFYDVTPSVSTASLTSGKKVADHPFASMVTTTQPRALGNLLSREDVDSGFLNRIIFAGGVHKERVAIGGVEVDIDPTVPYLSNIKGWVSFGKKIQWSEESAHAFTKYYHETLEPLKLKDDAGLLTRIDLTAKKLCLLLTVNMRMDTVPVIVIDQVKQIVNYLLACYGVGGAQIGHTLEYQVREDVLRVVDKFTDKGGATLRDIGQYLKRKKYPQKMVISVLDFMTKLGEVDAVKSVGVGRPTIRYKRAL